jgi:hypothetical protein
MMAPRGGPVPNPRWYLIPVRVLLVTFIVTLLSFAVSLLLGITGIVFAARLRHVSHPNLTVAYRYIALPAAATVAGIVLVGACAMEARRYRQLKMLRKMEDEMQHAN